MERDQQQAIRHALRTEEGALRLTAAAVTLACGLLPALRIRKRTPRKNR